MGKLSKQANLEELHKIDLEMLKLIDEICDKEQISYFMQGGTLLGAVRDKGFIPWDDDADIMMYREEFDRFERCAPPYLKQAGFYLNDTDRVPKVCRMEEPDARVDIFIIDYLPNSLLKKKYKLFMLKLLQGMAKTDVDLSAYSLKGKLLVGVTGTLGKLFSEKKLLSFYKKMSVYGSCEASQKCFWSNDLYRFIHYEFDRDYWKDTQRMQFEDAMLFAPKNWDMYLKINYGDNYLTPAKENYYVSVPQVNLK